MVLFIIGVISDVPMDDNRRDPAKHELSAWIQSRIPNWQKYKGVLSKFLRELYIIRFFYYEFRVIIQKPNIGLARTCLKSSITY